MYVETTSLRILCGLSIVLAIHGCGPDKSRIGKTNETVRTGSSDASTKPHNRVAEKRGGNSGKTPFHLVEVPTTKTGIRFRHVSGNSKEKPFPAANGSGVGVLDYDLDGRYDLHFASGTHFPIDLKRRDTTNRFYRNLGDWSFEDVTAHTGLGLAGFSAGVAIGDYDADGFPDVYVTCFGKNQLFRNCGDGTFERAVTADGGSFSTSAAFLDYNGDGLLDLFVCNYGQWSYTDNRFCGDRKRKIRIFCNPKSLPPEPDVLLQNLGDGSFRNVAADVGLNSVVGRGQGVLATDVNGDGRIDLYLGNDIHPNFLFLNRGNGRFENLADPSGTAYDRDGHMQAGMGVAGADVDRDGRWNLLVTNFEGEHHTLYLQLGDGNFHDVSAERGIASASKPWVGWGAAFVDFDLDGWKDLIVTNGHVDDNLKELGRDSPYEHPALVWKNESGRFRFLGDSVGSYFRRPHPGRGLATVDLDNDGDTDVVITHQDQPPALLRNDANPTARRRSSFVLRLIGVRSNRDAIGSRIEISSKSAPRIEQIQGGGSYLSAHDLRVIVAIEDAEQPVKVEIAWPSGRKTSICGVTAGNQYDIVEPTSPGLESRVTRTQLHRATEGDRQHRLRHPRD